MKNGLRFFSSVLALALLLVSVTVIAEAATVPDARGTYAGSGTTTNTNCLNPANNGTDGFVASVSIPSQVGGTVSGTVTQNFSSGSVNLISFSGTLTGGGQFSGAFTFTNLVTGASGNGTFTGQLTGNTLGINFSGQFQVGEICNFTGSLSAARSGAIPAPIEFTGTRSDFDGDGKADVLWRNTTTGAVAVWLMDGFTFVGGVVANVPLTWVIQDVGDLNGDGKADLVWRNTTTGDVAVWLMDGFTFVGGIVANVAPASGWSIVRVGDLNGDGKADLVWRNTATGDMAAWLMDGLNILSTVVVATVPSDWVIQ